MKNILLSIFFILTLFSVNAQCDLCRTDASFQSEFCYTDILFPNTCAQFAFDKEVFLLTRGEVQVQVPIGIPETAYYLELAKDRNLIFSATDMVFLMAANDAWAKKKTELVVAKGKDIPLVKDGYKLLPSGLGIIRVHDGGGEQAQVGRIVEVHYRGMLADGTEFDSSFKRGQPIAFPLGQGRVIKGWDEGLAQLKEGSAAWFEVPSHLGYGENARGPIPANATLYFYVVMVNVK